MLMKIGTRVSLAYLALALLAGCSSTQKVSSQFWPPPPDPPRIQYLKKIFDSDDVVAKKSVSLIDLGQDQQLTIPIIKPYGLAVKKGIIYITDTIQMQVIILDLPGKKASYLKGNKGPGQLSKPINIAVDDDGNVYVTDTLRKAVLKYGPDGEFVDKVGDDEMKPVAVAVDDLYIYILDADNGLVRVYDRKSHASVRTFGQDGVEKGRLFKPLGIGVSHKGGVYVTNLDGRIVHFDRDGHPLRMFGKLGTGLSQFNRPRSITFDEDGVMYIVDAASQNVRLMTEEFQLLMSFGEPGTPGSLNVPAGIAVSTDNLSYYQALADPDFVVEKVIFAISQFGDNKISIYGLGKKKGVDYDALLKQRQDDIRKREERVLAEKAAREAKEAKEAKDKEAKDKEKGTQAPPANDGAR